MSDPRPRIGICTSLEMASWGVWHQPAALLPLAYVTAIQRAGGFALLIAPDPALVTSPEEVLDLLDGLILAGGNDVDPATYGQAPGPHTVHIVPERDQPELALARAALARDIPFLGICRGMQVLNVALGGTLHQHLPDLVGHEEHRRRPGTFEGTDHLVRLEPGTVAARAAGEAAHTTLSHHHQGVDALGEGLAVSGVSGFDDGLPEAIEVPGNRFALGVQWHPEADPSSPVVAALVAEARAYRRDRGAAASSTA